MKNFWTLTQAKKVLREDGNAQETKANDHQNSIKLQPCKMVLQNGRNLQIQTDEKLSSATVITSNLECISALGIWDRHYTVQGVM